MVTPGAIIGLVLIVGLPTIHAHDEQTCCNLAKSKGAFVGLVPENQTCGQTYSPAVPAAEPLFVDYAFCSSHCSGIQLSKASNPSQWAAPIAQFILPSIIFSMSIPRR